MGSGRYYIPNPRSGSAHRGTLKSALINSLAPGDRKKMIDDEADSLREGDVVRSRRASQGIHEQPFFNNSADPKTSKSRLTPSAQHLRGLKPRLDAIEQ